MARWGPHQETLAVTTLTREETWSFIQRCFAAAEHGFVFNLLKGNGGPGDYNFQQPRDLLALARDLGAEPRLNEGYLSDDFTLALMKTHPEEPPC